MRVPHRLRGLPAYVLDYSDLIAPNLVEKPFLKPVIVSGPNTGGGGCVGVCVGRGRMLQRASGAQHRFGTEVCVCVCVRARPVRDVCGKGSVR